MIRDRAAYREAAHAVIGRVLGLDCGEATIKPNADNTGEATYGYAAVSNPLHHWTRGDGPKRKLADAFCIALYAGAEAEKTFFGNDEPIIDAIPRSDRAPRASAAPA
jgi:hypothetical protein